MYIVDKFIHYNVAGLERTYYADPSETDDLGQKFLAMDIESGRGKIFCGADLLNPEEPAQLHFFLCGNAVQHVRVYNSAKKKVPLEAAEIRANQKLADAAILEELTTWACRFKAVELVARHQGMNIMTSRFVMTWSDKDGKWLLRARLTLRGFQDWYRHMHETYSGTASRMSQRIVSSECSCHQDGRPEDRWILITVDIEKAFLLGMSYTEIHETTGEPLREVFFSVPNGSEHILRQITGFESYDPRKHCLKCKVPGTGTADAPRAFSLKLAKITRGAEADYHPCPMDPELEMRHGYDKQGNCPILGIVAKHVDDLKIAGPRRDTARIQRILERTFGNSSTRKMCLRTLEWNTPWNQELV